MKNLLLHLTLVLAVLMAVCPLAAVAQEGDNPNTLTTIIIVRHAEKGTGPNPMLAPAGEKRAKKLAAMLSATHLDAVFSTDTTRTKETVKNCANQAHLAISVYPPTKNLIKEILETMTGKTVLVAGHSNTVPQMLIDAGLKNPPNIDMEYDNIFIVCHSGSQFSVTQLKY